MPRFQITNECWEFQEIRWRPRTLPLIYIWLIRNLGLSDCNEAEWQFLLSWTLIIIKNTCIRNKFKYFAHNFYYKAYELFPSSISGKQYMCSRINTVPKAPINKCMKQEAGGDLWNAEHLSSKPLHYSICWNWNSCPRVELFILRRLRLKCCYKKTPRGMYLIWDWFWAKRIIVEMKKGASNGGKVIFI